jgi:hypothetical protein
MAVGPEYLVELKKRSEESHVHREFQLLGLEIADILGDRKHKSLYIKLAKNHKTPYVLLAAAKEVAEKKDVKSKGAYFMAIVSGTAKLPAKSEIFRYSKKRNDK